MKIFFVGLFIVLLIWYAIKAISRLIAIFIAPQSPNNDKTNRKFAKGNITIDNIEKPEKPKEKQNGQYVDFEEVK